VSKNIGNNFGSIIFLGFLAEMCILKVEVCGNLNPGGEEMNVLVIDPENRCTVDRPYLYKFGQGNVTQNEVYIGQYTVVDLVDTESEGYSMLQNYNYDSVIINVGQADESCDLLDKIRSSRMLRHLPVTLI